MIEVHWDAMGDTDLSPVSDLADRWRAYTAHLEEYGSVLGEDVAKKLGEDVFEGLDADAARERLQSFKNAITGDVLERATAIRDGFDEGYEALEAALDQRETITVDAGNAGLVISPDGTVALARQTQTVMSVEETAAQRQLINGTAAEVAACMDAFVLADEQLAGIIHAALEEPSELPMPIGENPELHDIPTGPEHVADWWADLDAMEREAYLEAFPEFLGGLDGLPADARDDANRTVLDSEIAGMDSQISSIENRIAELENSDFPLNNREVNELIGLRGELDDLQEKRDVADDLREQVNADSTSKAERYLLDFSLEGDGQAVVAIGNPDTADNTAVHVPGTYSDLSNFDTQVNRADTMQNDATDWYDGETAVIAWLGYDAPDDLVQAGDIQYAHDATGDLNSFLNGLNASHESGDSHTTVMGHSYGSTVVGDTARTYEHMNADEVVLIASPGATTLTAEELNVGADHVWATTADGDAIGVATALPVFGTNPASEGFGGNTFTSDAVYKEDAGFLEKAKQIHAGYFGNNNEGEPNAARENLAAIITGNTGDVY